MGGLVEPSAKFAVTGVELSIQHTAINRHIKRVEKHNTTVLIRLNHNSSVVYSLAGTIRYIVRVYAK